MANYLRMDRERFVKLMITAAEEAETIQKRRNEFNGKEEEIDFYTIAIWDTQLELINIDMNQYRGGSGSRRLENLFEDVFDNLPSEEEQTGGRYRDSLGCLFANYVNEKHLILIEIYHDNDYFEIEDHDGTIENGWLKNDRIIDWPIFNRLDSMTRKNGAIMIDYEGHVYHDGVWSRSVYDNSMTYARYFELKKMLRDGFTVADWENKRRSYYFFETEDDEAMF